MGNARKPERIVGSMADVFIYADETGDLDMSGRVGTSSYFGFGTAILPDGHGDVLWEGLRLRCHLEQRGVRMPSGMHAKNDSHATRDEVFGLIRRQAPRFDTTFLLKSRANESIREAGPVRLYKMAWYLHFNEIVRRVSDPGDSVFVVVASLKTHSKRDAIRAALVDVCDQSSRDREIIPCIWDASSSWGIQVADYGLWATQRVLEGRPCSWYESCVAPTLRSRLTPWGHL